MKGFYLASLSHDWFSDVPVGSLGKSWIIDLRAAGFSMECMGNDLSGSIKGVEWGGL